MSSLFVLPYELFTYILLLGQNWRLILARYDIYKKYKDNILIKRLQLLEYANNVELDPEEYGYEEFIGYEKSCRFSIFFVNLSRSFCECSNDRCLVHPNKKIEELENEFCTINSSKKHYEKLNYNNYFMEILYGDISQSRKVKEFPYLLKNNEEYFLDIFSDKAIIENYHLIYLFKKKIYDDFIFLVDYNGTIINLVRSDICKGTY